MGMYMYTRHRSTGLPPWQWSAELRTDCCCGYLSRYRYMITNNYPCRDSQITKDHALLQILFCTFFIPSSTSTMPSTLVSTKEVRLPQLSVRQTHSLPCGSDQPTFSKLRVNWMAVTRRIEDSSTQHYTTTSGFTPKKLGIRKGPSISNVENQNDIK